MKPPKIALKGIDKSFQTPSGTVQAVRGVNMTVEEGELVTLVGPSGCGKSTIFNMIAGLAIPTTGDVTIDGRSVVGEAGHVGYMLQKDLLLPWRTVLDNVVLGAELLGVPRQRVERQARDLMATFGLAGFENAWPARLSGGMRQRAALMRTVLADQDVMLLDEPFGALDAMTKGMMQEWLLDIWSRFKRTIVFITHDIDEAIFLADRVYVMSARPGSVKREIRVPIERPRVSHEVTTTRIFGEIKHQVLAAIADEIRATYGVAQPAMPSR
jgi:ABC-type nitrate/sulfonate/bicarbonate transport system ATPase subunit